MSVLEVDGRAGWSGSLGARTELPLQLLLVLHNHSSHSHNSLHLSTPSISAASARTVESVSEKKLKSVNIWQSYKQERGCLVHFARRANTLLKDEESARDNHVLACNFAKYSPI